MRLAVWIALLFGPALLHADTVVMQSGMKHDGLVGKIKSLRVGSGTGGPDAQATINPDMIEIVDDNLRRTFVSRNQVADVTPAAGGVDEKIMLAQPIAEAGPKVSSVGFTTRVTPFDEFGRRILTFATPQGSIDVVQGITEITPTYCRVQGLSAAKSYVWDMRIATSSLPRDTLSRILQKQIDPKNADQRLKIVRVYIQAERYQDARRELEEIVKTFPDLAELKQQLTVLTQLNARRLIKEIELRRTSGQHELAYGMLKNFPPDGVDGPTLKQVAELREEYNQIAVRGGAVKKLLETHLAKVDDATVRGRFEAIVKEISDELNINTLDRMGDYQRLAEGGTLKPEQLLALAVSGWLLGEGHAEEKPTLALSLFEVRALVRKYLTSANKPARDKLLQQLSTYAGASPEYLVQLLDHMKPAYDLPEADAEIAGQYSLTTTNAADGAPLAYSVQLPPEYDPYRSYPAIVTLNGAFSTPQQQLDWWAGTYDAKSKFRLGQGARHGYIVIAPVWLKPHQTEYQFSAAEHAAVLGALRDACRRFAIDTNRVFLTGHSIGGDAAWDIGVSHPDLWAGVIPIAGAAGKYVTRLIDNGRYVSLYLIGGELDGNHRTLNEGVLDAYFNRGKYDATFVEYRGRGHEHFQDEVQRIFQWMNVHRRNPAQGDFTCGSMRPWENYFWWLELEELPQRGLIAPAAWPPPRNYRPLETSGRASRTGPNNVMRVETQAASGTIWLAPDLVNFQNRLIITCNGRTTNLQVAPTSEVILEDVRTRGDRHHPYWAKLEFPIKPGK